MIAPIFFFTTTHTHTPYTDTIKPHRPVLHPYSSFLRAHAHPRPSNPLTASHPLTLTGTRTHTHTHTHCKYSEVKLKGGRGKVVGVFFVLPCCKLISLILSLSHSHVICHTFLILSLQTSSHIVSHHSVIFFVFLLLFCFGVAAMRRLNALPQQRLLNHLLLCEGRKE